MSDSHSIQSVAIVGAGLAGVSCAVALSKSVNQVTVFEQEQQPGGRMVARCQDGYQYDSGAQYFTARSDAFRQQVKDWLDNWLAHEWPAWLVDLQDQGGDALSHSDGAIRYIGRPVMHSVIEDMADLCDVHYETEIKKVSYQKKESGWQLVDKRRNKYGPFDAVVIAIPAPQAVVLLSAAPELANIAGEVDMTATWSVMAAFDQSLQLGFDGAYIVSEELSWIARDNSKIERDDSHGKEIWVIHATPEWSEKNKKMSAKKVVSGLLAALSKVSGRDIPKPHFTAAELWQHAKPVNPLDKGCLYDPELRIGACGDWCYAARVEGAYISGITMAAKILHDA